MTDTIDELGGLRSDERERLRRFAMAFERLDAGSYSMFAAVPDQAAVDEAQVEALERIPSGRRRDAVRAAVKVFTDEATVAYSRRFSLPELLMFRQSLPDRAEDRVRFLASVERAVVGLILWHELDDDDLAALLGPWSAFVQGPG